MAEDELAGLRRQLAEIDAQLTLQQSIERTAGGPAKARAEGRIVELRRRRHEIQQLLAELEGRPRPA